MTPVSILTIQPLLGGGGPPIQHTNFLRMIDRSRFACHALLPEGHPMAERYREVSAAVHFLPTMTTIPRSKSPVRLARYFFDASKQAERIAALARDLKARLIHSVVESYPPAGMAARRLRVPSVIQVLGMTIFRPPWVAAVYCRLLNRLADRIIGCQEIIPRLMQRHGVPEHKLRVVYNGVDMAEIARQAVDGLLPDSMPDRLKVGMVAGLDPRKGHLLFIQAAQQIVRHRQDVDFYIFGTVLGNDGFSKDIRRQAQASGLGDRLHFPGRVDNIAAWIKAMDVHCIPSLTEALSVAGLEAMTLERPVVATRVDGNPVEVLEGETGLLSNPNDPEDMADKIVELLDAPDRRAAMGRKGRARVAELFTLESNTRRLENVFAELLTSDH